MGNYEEKINNTIKIMLKGASDHTCVDDIKKKLQEAFEKQRPLKIKLGLDPTAPDIHLGHSVVLRKIRQLQDLGHRAVIIIGDYTARIGDPSGKSKTRKQLSEEEIFKSAETYKKQILKIIDPEKTDIRFNSEWLSGLNFGDVIELCSKCTVARILERDDFSNRYANHLPLSLHELLYPLAQAYDSVVVKSDIEMGGSDQTFNILMGRNIQKSYGQEPQLTIFMPLLEGTDGIEKMSKSLGNYIGINESAHVMYEKIMKIPDELIARYYTLCTDVHPDEIKNLLANKSEKGKNPRDTKMNLAHEITKLYHGEGDAILAQKRFVDVFQKGEVPSDILSLNVDVKSDVLISDQIVNSLIELGEFKSKSDIRRIFSQGGARINDQKVLNVSDLAAQTIGEKVNILRLGKGKMFKICKMPE
ncbi:MAG: tyrosine--tRNA ligase [Oscillospiraceae bacterium]|jgi:tyrosyl-tRNA synthetase|nr:tyrosine--tRNA ligase [Oscillospiraceae bacterium]